MLYADEALPHQGNVLFVYMSTKIHNIFSNSALCHLKLGITSHYMSLFTIPSTCPPKNGFIIVCASFITLTDSDIITYIGTLWAIWKLRNAQVFRQHQPTSASIALQLNENLHLHTIFVQQQHDPTRNPLDPPTPPDFDVANIGQHTSSQQPIILQIAGHKHKLKGVGGLAWVEGRGNQNPHHQHGSFCYSNSIISMVATACQYACTWAASNNYMHIRILTDSRELVRILRTSNTGPIDTKWTIANILRTAKSFTTCQVVRVPRHQIEVAHELAKWSCHYNRSFS